MAKYKLLVEGKGDQEFFHAYCNQVIGNNLIDIFPPKSLDNSSGDGWGNLIKNLPILLAQVKNGDIDKLGIILDADYPPNDAGGFAARFNLITEQLQIYGYNIPTTHSPTKGDIFQHPDGLSDIGLWIMPDHQGDGMLENFIEAMIASDTAQQALLDHAHQAITTLPITLFNQRLHHAKAKIFTWRAWQSKPGLSLSKALNEGILHTHGSADFQSWLTSVFK